MPRNIEIKARVDSVDALLARACEVAGAEAETIEQDDTFYAVPHGRLKLRRFADGSAELIHYLRPDTTDPKPSDYVRVRVVDPAALHEVLARGCGVLGRVRKRRRLLLAGQTRIHLDRVDGLGDFVEIEVVLHDAQPDAEGRRIAEALVHRLGIAGAERIAGAYLDLLEPASDR